MAKKKEISIEEEFEELSKPKKKINSKTKGNANERQFAQILNERFFNGERILQYELQKKELIL